MSEAEERIATLLGKALVENVPEVVAFAVEVWLLPFLPVAAAVLKSKELADEALARGLSIDEAVDGVGLIYALKHSDDTHQAWLAAEIFGRHCKSVPLFVAAIQGASG